MALSVITSIADVSLFYPQQLVMRGSSAAWMIPMLSMLITLGVWALISPVLVRTDKQDLITLCEKSLGRFAMRAMCLLIAFYMIADMTTLARTFTEAVVTTVLPRSPISFIAAPFFLVAAFYAWKGIEGISRVSLVLWSWLAVGLVALLVLNLNWMRPDKIFPLLGYGVMPLITGSGLFLSVFVNILILTLFCSRLRNPKEVRSIGYISTILIGLTYMLVTMAFLMVFSPEAAMRSPFPLYQLGRLIYIGRFIQRLEASFVFIWVVMAVIKMAVTLFMSTYLIATAFRMPVYRPLVAAVTLIVFDLSYYPRSFVETVSFNNKYIVAWSWSIVIVVPLLVTMAYRIRKRGEAKKHEEQERSADAS
nr:GerAB/ArcD/ProY family transporter [Tumebacillus amylolyticus]